MCNLSFPVNAPSVSLKYNRIFSSPSEHYVNINDFYEEKSSVPHAHEITIQFLIPSNSRRHLLFLQCKDRVRGFWSDRDVRSLVRKKPIDFKRLFCSVACRSVRYSRWAKSSRGSQASSTDWALVEPWQSLWPSWLCSCMDRMKVWFWECDTEGGEGRGRATRG